MQGQLVVSTGQGSAWARSNVERGVGWPRKELLLGQSQRCNVG